MEENRNEQHVKALRRLLEIVDSQNKTEYSEALKAGIQALQDQEDSPNTEDDMRLSGDASQQLLQLTQRVLADTVTSADKTRAAKHLAHLGGHR